MREALTDPSSYRFTAALVEDTCWNDVPAAKARQLWS